MENGSVRWDWKGREELSHEDLRLWNMHFILEDDRGKSLRIYKQGVA